MPENSEIARNWRLGARSAPGVTPSCTKFGTLLKPTSDYDLRPSELFQGVKIFGAGGSHFGKFGTPKFWGRPIAPQGLHLAGPNLAHLLSLPVATICVPKNYSTGSKFWGPEMHILENLGPPNFGGRGNRGVVSHESDRDPAPSLACATCTFWAIPWLNYACLNFRLNSGGHFGGEYLELASSDRCQIFTISGDDGMDFCVKK